MLSLLAAGRGATLGTLGPLGSRAMTMRAPSPYRLEQIATMKAMNDYFPKVVAQLKQVADDCNIANETTWLEKMLYHNVPGGKMVRGLVTYHAILTLLGKDDPAVKERAINLAWAQEMLQAAVLVADDISDDCVLRRGKESWHAVAGKDAVFDAMLLLSCTYILIDRNCQGETAYRTKKLFTETTFQICIGQNRDNHCKEDGRTDLDGFTMERYVEVCEHKSGGYTFTMPAITAFHVCGLNDEAAHDAARDMGSDLGLLYQGQDDYLDIYGLIEKMGKDRTDIRNGKASWAITAALEVANKEQRQVLKDNYGFYDQAKVDKVMKIYDEIKMKDVFQSWESKLIKKIERKIDKYSHVLPPEIFTHALETVKYHVNR